MDDNNYSLLQFVFLLWTLSSSSADTQSFESQKIVTEEPSEVQDGEQDYVSPVEEAPASTEAPSEATTEAEDDILLEDSMVDDSKNTVIVDVSAKEEIINEEPPTDEEITENNKEPSHEAINTIDDTKDNTYDDTEYYYDEDYYYDEEEKDCVSSLRGLWYKELCTKEDRFICQAERRAWRGNKTFKKN